MAMPKKGSRKITVNNREYLWRVLADEDLYYKSFIIESVMHQDYQLTGYFEYKRELVISPSIIQQIISKAEKEGWVPGESSDKRLCIDTSSGLKIKTTALWKPDLFKDKQILQKGITNNHYFYDNNGLHFSWGAFDVSRDFCASCKVEEISHETYGEINYIESKGNKFIIKGENIETTLDFNTLSQNDIVFWELKVKLSNYIVLPKKNYY